MKDLPVSVRSFAEMTGQFEYNAGLPLQWKEHGIKQQEDVSIHDISYASPGHGLVRAYWVVPTGEGPFPGVIFVHPGPGDRSSFLDEAVTFAHREMASFVVEAPWSKGEDWGRTMGEPKHDREEFTRIAIDLRRAVDAFASRVEVNPNSLGYVGHSFGALFGGLLSGVEKRLRAFVLMAGVGSFSDVSMLNDPSLQGERLQNYRQELAPIDPIYYVGRATPAALFFQFGSKDTFFPREKLSEYAEAGSQPKLVRWYDTDHYFPNQVEAQNDRSEWLQAQLSQQ